MSTYTDREETLLRGYIPLDGEYLNKLNNDEEVTEINFAGNGYLNDGILHMLKRKLAEKPERCKNLKKINLVGCNLITDYGIRCLEKILRESSQLVEVNLDGCERLTDNTAAMLIDIHMTQPTMIGHMCGTDINYLASSSVHLKAQGRPSIGSTAKDDSSLLGHVLVVPDPNLKESFAEFLDSSTTVERKGFTVHRTSLKVDNWTLAVTETTNASRLFEPIISHGLSQVIIPFNASSEPKEIKHHVMMTISQVVAKEPAWHGHKDSKINLAKVSERPFLQTHVQPLLTMKQQDDGTMFLRNISASSTSQMGVWVSKGRLTRSNPYFELFAEAMPERCGLLVGCLLDLLYSDQNPMDSSSDYGGYVDGIELKEDTTVGFGVEGDWLSEYVPDGNAKFFYIVNGEKRAGQMEAEMSEMSEKITPCGSMYPIISILGEVEGNVSMPPLVQRPKEEVQKLAASDKYEHWIEKGFTQNCLVDSHGKMMYIPSYNNPKSQGIFIGRTPIEASGSFAVEIDKLVYAPSTDATNSSDNFLLEVGCATETFKKKPGSSYVMAIDVNYKTKTSQKAFRTNKVELSNKTEGPATVGLLEKGDIIGVEWEKKEEKTYDFTFKYCEKVVYKETVIFEKQGSIMPWVGINIPPYKGEDVFIVKLLNLLPEYRPPVPKRNAITLGRAHFANVMDDGIVEFKPNVSKEKSMGDLYGHFISKTPFNKEMLKFTVEMKDMSNTGALFGIGVSEPDVSITGLFMGWKPGTLAYHADNGQIYDNLGSGSNNYQKQDDEFDYNIHGGDTLIVEIMPDTRTDTNMQLIFDEFGTLDSHQTVMVHFYKNAVLAHAVPHYIAGDGLYPAFSMKWATVKIHGFYSETNDLWEMVLSSTKTEETHKAKEKKKEKERSFKGTEFLLVGVATGNSDAEGKVDLLKQQLDFENWPQLNNVINAISEMERDILGMDLEDQQVYGRLCNARDNLANFVKHRKKRMRFISGGTDPKLRERVLQEIVTNQKRLLDFQPLTAEFTTSYVLAGETIMKNLSSLKIIPLSEIFSAIDFPEKLSQLFDSDNSVLAVLKHLQSKGQLLLLENGQETMIVSIEYFALLEERVDQLLPASLKTEKTVVPAIGKASHVWTQAAIDSKLLTEIEARVKKQPLVPFLQHSLGLVSLPCLRTRPEDEQCIMTTLENIGSPAVSMDKFWSPDKDMSEFVVMKQTYTFPLSSPRRVLPILIAGTTKYGRVIILTPEGVVYQNGAVQTVIIKHQSSDQTEIIVESSCFMPSLENIETSLMSKETPAYVRDYTFHVFSIYVDVIMDILFRLNIPMAIQKFYPDTMVKTSVGCKHIWTQRSDTEISQSVCTMCNMCCDKGENCVFNGIMGEHLRHCPCDTKVIGCHDCGICRSCADELWSLKTRLRPHGTMLTALHQTIDEKTKKLTEDKSKVAVRVLRDPVNQPVLPLDPHVYNQVEFVNLNSDNKFLCLKEESDGSITKVYPGDAALVKQLEDLTTMTSADKKNMLKNGDHIRVKITDPLGCSLYKEKDDNTAATKLQIDPVYFGKGREVKVIHETGIVVYDSASTAVPVGQFISCMKMDKDHDTFKIKVISTGKSGTISMGLAPSDYPPNRQCGWNTKSIGYHADDGGIFLESGYPTRKTQACAVGDIMELYIDFSKDKGFFRKNGEKMIELNLNPNKLAYYPMIGMHSVGEAVQIMDKSLWEMKDAEADKTFHPPAFPTFKYGNLWISPGDQVTLTKMSGGFTGWVTLNNPSKDPVGFKITLGDLTTKSVYGVIEAKKDFVHWFQESLAADNMPALASVEWTSLESGRNYETEEMKKIFGETMQKFNALSHTHKLPVVTRISASTKVESLQKKIDSTPSGPGQSQNVLVLSIYKNHRLLTEYWLKNGNYQVSVESKNKNSKFILKYPKCPTFAYPKAFQKGMKLFVCLEKGKKFAECVIVDTYPGGKNLALEYSPKDAAALNTTVCMMTNSHAFKFAADEFNENEAVVLNYEARNTPANLVETFVHAPHYLLSEGSRKVRDYLHPEWKASVLQSVMNCTQQLTRYTVQERHITQVSRNIYDWDPSEWNALFTFLPRHLTEVTLTFPVAMEMFKDIGVHRLCYFGQILSENVQTLETYGANEDSFITFRHPAHFVDIEGIVPSSDIQFDYLFADAKSAYAYVALITSRLLLPSYKNILVTEENEKEFTREQIETLLHRMLQSYASLCGIYSTTWGGIQCTKDSGEKKIKYSVQHADGKIVKRLSDMKADHESAKSELSEQSLVKAIDSFVCKAHYYSHSKEMTDHMISLDYEDFTPYAEFVTDFHWVHSSLETIPDDFFEKFPQLEKFKLGHLWERMPKIVKLPGGVNKAKKLRLIELTNLEIESLPEDIFMSESVMWITVVGCPVKELPNSWPESSPLKVLVLQGLKLTSLPEQISHLNNLRELELCYNQLSSLPDSLAELKNLTMLKLIGVPWLKLEMKKPQMTLEKYQSFWKNHPSFVSTVGEDAIMKLFEKHDYNRNGSLDEEELGGVNKDLFFMVPRIGMSDINDEVCGGIPPVIFNMKNLRELYLNFNAINMVPAAINNLQNLITLSLSDNPLLESLPGLLGHLPNITSINIQSCPQIRTPPTEIVSRGFESVKAYLKRLAGGFTECRRTKLMVVGLGGAGKTSLIRALMATDKKTSGTEKETPTDGIDIKPWTVASEDGREVTYSTWDFAGQAVYYNTHQFFLSKRAVYLLLWSMRQGYEHAGLDFWLSSICCHAPGTPIIVVGTQCDLIPKAEIPIKELLERYPQIASFHRVSSITGEGIKDLQDSLLDVTLQQGYMGEKIPQVWLNFEKRILAERLTKVNYIKWEVAKEYAMVQGIYDERDVRMAVQLLHDLGTVQYFDNDFLRDYVVINPQWIVDVMACVVSAQSSPIQKNHGRFLHSDITTVWEQYDPNLHEWLLRLTEDFDLTFPLPTEAVNIVPCLLSGEPPDDLEWPRKKEGVRETKMVYRFTYLPSGLFNRAQVRLFQLSDGKKVWKKGSLLVKNKHSALIKQTDNKELVVLVQGPRPENILFLIHEVFESIIEESFNGVSYELYLPCPDCVEKEGTTDPDLLCSKLIQRAKDHKAPFIQCYKYFHWISMAQLQEKMPTDSREVADFDFQLQQSIVALQELNNELVVDCAIIYAVLDIPGPNDSDAISPFQIRDDIIGWGHTCWMAENVNEVSTVDLTAAIKNCKILIALVSDSFERDPKCNNLLVYAREILNKETIIIVIGNSMEWQNKDLGMKIGQQERKLMVKTKSRYEVAGGRRDELKEWLAEKMQMMKDKELSLPEVFISYCWSNSRQAQEKSMRIKEEALGHGDPRDIKNQLERDGNLHCWIDTEYVGKEKKGIFADMAAGIRNSKVILAFISDEYSESDNCMMELRFGILNIGLPVIAVIVGTGNQWKETEVAMLLRRAKATEVYMQKDNPEGVNVIIKHLKEALKTQALKAKKPAAKKDMKKDGETEKKKKEGNSHVAYQEEVELIQRKFMRHIIGSVTAMDQTALPRLVVVDFVKAAGKTTRADEGRESSMGTSSSIGSSMKRLTVRSKKFLRPKSATKSRDRLNIDESVFEDGDMEDWSKESFCIKVLCEHEQGWHFCQEMYPLAFRNREQLETFLQGAAPYLFRIYTILKQSPLKLKCFSGGKGEAFLDWIRLASEDNLDFVGAMTHLRSELDKDDAAEFCSCLARCRLPSGKIVWLCKEHQGMQRVSKLSMGTSGSSYSKITVLYPEDKFMSENILESKKYKNLKGKKSDKVPSALPKPVPLPEYVGPDPETLETVGRASPRPSDRKEKKETTKESKNQEVKGESTTKPKVEPKLSKQTPSEDKEEKNVSHSKLEEPKLDKTPEIHQNIPKNEQLDIKDETENHTVDAKLINTELKQDTTVKKNDDKIPTPEAKLESKKERKDGKSEKNDKETPETNKDTVQQLQKEEAIKTIEEVNEQEEESLKAKEEINSLGKDDRKIDVRSKPKAKPPTTEEKKDEIKKMLLGSDNKAISQALKSSYKNSSKSNYAIQATDTKHPLQKSQSGRFGNIKKGSNVKRLYESQTLESSSQKDESISSSLHSSKCTSPNLESSLNITTVSNKGSADSKTSVDERRGANKRTNKEKEMIHPLEKVRPKKIIVKPKEISDENKPGVPSLGATGSSLRTKRDDKQTKNPTDSKTSQACVIQ
ncbi:uncharacterized protein LOC128240741 isoform X2 [Mya arenaria]|uniref:uncharacterized protein LOC128240741 isoform X2 n=1 Tax=Mya arenaria TaxID=6604 RepID=UPI0022E814E7|nr:uncharacterized protein LOC128240741 isoform X2 [Mya arenaria]